MRHLTSSSLGTLVGVRDQTIGGGHGRACEARLAQPSLGLGRVGEVQVNATPHERGEQEPEDPDLGGLRAAEMQVREIAAGGETTQDGGEAPPQGLEIGR